MSTHAVGLTGIADRVVGLFEAIADDIDARAGLLDGLTEAGLKGLVSHQGVGVGAGGVGGIFLAAGLGVEYERQLLAVGVVRAVVVPLIQAGQNHTIHHRAIGRLDHLAAMRKGLGAGLVLIACQARAANKSQGCDGQGAEAETLSLSALAVAAVHDREKSPKHQWLVWVLAEAGLVFGTRQGRTTKINFACKICREL